MDTEPEMQDPELDARLRQLPRWQPPADFSARLAAAAARQAQLPNAAPVSTLAWLRRQALSRLPLAIGAGAGAAALLLLTLPWDSSTDGLALPWLVASTAAVLGIVLAVRVLRAP